MFYRNIENSYLSRWRFLFPQLQTHTSLSQSVITVCLKLLHIAEEKAMVNEDGTSGGEHKQAHLELALEPSRLSQRPYRLCMYLPPW